MDGIKDVFDEAIRIMLGSNKDDDSDDKKKCTISWNYSRFSSIQLVSSQLIARPAIAMARKRSRERKRIGLRKLYWRSRHNSLLVSFS